MSKIDSWIKAIKEDISLKSKFFWDINDTDIQKFKNNFTKYNKKLGLFLLDMMLYYNYCHCKELTMAAAKDLKRNIWLNALKKGNKLDNSAEIQNYIEKYLDESYIFPVSNIDESGKSAELIESYYKELSPSIVPKENYKALSVLLEIIAVNKPKSIIFVDDIIGTGKQFSKFYSKENHFSIKKTIEECVNNNPEIDFYYIVFAADEKNLNKLQIEYNNLNILSVELFTEENRITSKNNEYWEIYGEYYETFIKDLKMIEKDFPRLCKFSLDLPMIYVSGRAQNTSFEYFWNNYDGRWNALKAR